MWWLAALLLAGAVVLSWDDIRDAVFRWADRHGYDDIARVILHVDRIVGQLKKLVRVVVIGPRGHEVVVEERTLDIDELPEEVRAAVRRQSQVEIDVTHHVLEQEH